MGMRLKARNDPSLYTEAYIQQILARDFMTHPKYVLYNLYVFGWESDFLFCTTSGYWYEVEIKISLADFKNDFKHKERKYETLRTGEYVSTWVHRGKTMRKVYPNQPRPNYFSYCVPYFLVDKVKPLVPDGYGLYYVTEYGQLENVIAPTAIHKEKYTAEKLKLTEKFYYAYDNWRLRYMRLKGNANQELEQKIKELRAENKWLRAEYQAATGLDVNENL